MALSELELVIGFGLLIVIILTVFIALFLITAYRRKLKHRQQLVKLQFERKQELLQTQLEIQEQTLKTISEEIHDNVGQVLSLAKLNLNTLQDKNDPKIVDTKNLIGKAINDLRNLSRSIHGDRIAEIGLQQSIIDELTIIENSGIIATQLKIIGSVQKLQPQIEMVLFRILQEAMNNALKHSKAKNIIVQLNYQPELFILTIEDDGIGFEIESLQSTRQGIGLKSMKNRAALIGGRFSINPSLIKGTFISIELPLTNSII